MLHWRFIITSITAAVIVILQGVYINPDILIEYIVKDGKPSNMSYHSFFPKLLHVDKNGNRSVHYVARFVKLHLPFYGGMFTFLVLYIHSLWKYRVTHWCFFISIIILTFSAMMFPFGMKIGWVVYVVRALQGASSNVYLLLFDYLVVWIPPKERATVCSIVYGGQTLSLALIIWYTELVCRVLKWDYVFYIGTPVIILVGLLLCFTSATPEFHLFVTDEEKNYITNQFAGHVNKDKKRERLILKVMFAWKPFLASLYVGFCLFWCWNVILFVLPIYLEHIHGIKVFQTTTLTALPFVCSWLFGIILGVILDVVVRCEKISMTAARRICILTSCIVPLVSLLVINAVGTTFAICLIWLIIVTWSIGLTGIFSNYMDIAPNFGGILISFSLLNQILSFFLVFILFYLILNFNSLSSYWTIFGLTSGMYVIQAVVCFWISAEEAPWNNPEVEV